MQRQRSHPQASPPSRSTRNDPPVVPHHLTSKPARGRSTVFNSKLVFFNFLFCTTLVLLDVTPFSCSRISRQSARISRDELYSSSPSDTVLSATPKILSFNTHNFTLDSKPIRLISGSVHYFRIPPSQWRSALLLARHMGLNAIETYVPWNLHEPANGIFRFSGILDLSKFLSIAHELDLLVLLRPGPYICSEWDFGGLPPYLLSDPTMRVRTIHPTYMKVVRRYLTRLTHIIDPFIGRPIVGLQIENEYGQYVGDHLYMRALVDLWNDLGISKDKLVLFTSDNGNEENLLNGSPFQSSEVLKTINFGSHVDKKMNLLRKVQPEGPPMVMEFWIGWYDHWGTDHHTRNAIRIAKYLKGILFDHASSVNLYMFMGGTNFGFMSGANMDEERGYEADTTSYDYDAFLAEHGGIRTLKFQAAREVIRDFWLSIGDNKRLAVMNIVPPDLPSLSPYSGKIPLTASIPLLNVLDEVSSSNVHTQFPQSMEESGGDYGYALYRHSLEAPAEKDSIIQITGVHDYAYILFDGLVARKLERKHPKDTTPDGSETPTDVKLTEGTTQIDVLVENSGRVNYGLNIHDHKGLIGNITLNDNLLEDFDMYLLSFPQDHEWLRDIDLRTSIDKSIKRMHSSLDHPPMGEYTSQPCLFFGSLIINPESHQATNLPGTYCQIFGRGALWVNGFNVGRFNTEFSAPQGSLFVPGSLLREGTNDIVVLHLDMKLAREPPAVEFFDHPN